MQFKYNFCNIVNTKIIKDMEKSIEQKVQDMLEMVQEAIKHFSDIIQEFKQYDNFTGALRCSIEINMLKKIEDNLKNILNK